MLVTVASVLLSSGWALLLGLLALNRSVSSSIARHARAAGTTSDPDFEETVRNIGRAMVSTGVMILVVGLLGRIV
jgi:hypothetical protein